MLKQVQGVESDWFFFLEKEETEPTVEIAVTFLWVWENRVIFTLASNH